jgi:hypothetical protein
VPLSKSMAQFLTSSIYYFITTTADVSSNVFTINLTAFSWQVGGSCCGGNYLCRSNSSTSASWILGNIGKELSVGLCMWSQMRFLSNRQSDSVVKCGVFRVTQEFAWGNILIYLCVLVEEFGSGRKNVGRNEKGFVLLPGKTNTKFDIFLSRK